MQKFNKIYASLFVLVALLIIGWFFFYEYSVRWLEKELDKAQARLKEKGYVVSYSKVDISGNPLTVKAVIKDLNVQDPSGLFEWQGQEAIFRINPWTFHRVTYEFPGDQNIRIPQNPYFSFGELHLEGAQGNVDLTSEGKVEALSLSGTRIISSLGKTVQPVSLEDFTLNLENIMHPLTLKVSFQGNLVNLEKLLNISPLDHPFEISIVAALGGFNAKEFPKSLAEWRDGGGVLDINHISLNWDPIHVEAEGTLTLDKNMYPLGSFSSQITGFQEAMPYMVKLGWIKEKNVSTTLFVLNLFSSPESQGQKKLAIPITLQNKKVSIGPANLFKLKPIPEL